MGSEVACNDKYQASSVPVQHSAQSQRGNAVFEPCKWTSRQGQERCARGNPVECSRQQMRFVQGIEFHSPPPPPPAGAAEGGGRGYLLLLAFLCGGLVLSYRKDARVAAVARAVFSRVAGQQSGTELPRSSDGANPTRLRRKGYGRTDDDEEAEEEPIE